MTGPVSVQPDPSAVGGVSAAPFALLPDAVRMFKRRAQRFAALADVPGPATPVLRFLGQLTHVQADVAANASRPSPPSGPEIAQAQGAQMPILNRRRLANSDALAGVLAAFLDAVASIEKPAAAADALRLVRGADAPARREMIDNVLADAIPFDGVAPHVFVAAGVQIFAALCASALDARDVTPVAVGVCPVCGGPPVASLVAAFHGAEGARYAACSCCGTQWNEVRIKCLACGSTKDIGYRELAHEGDAATVKAEVCDACQSWLKIMYGNKNPALDPVADDVASLGLDLLMRDTEFRPAGFNPFLIGY